MDPLTLFGLFAITAMLVCYALEAHNRWFVFGFAMACALGSIYGFLQGAWPFGLVEAVWALVALRRWKAGEAGEGPGDSSGPRGAPSLRATLFEGAGRPLPEAGGPHPAPGPGQVLLRVNACGVCRTDLHIVDGELPEPKLPLVLGHQIVGTVAAIGGGGRGARRFALGDRVGVPWLGGTDGTCRFCRSGRENL